MKKFLFMPGSCLMICLVSNGQNVGIGTTSPSQKLDVVGNLKLSGAIMPGGNAGTAGQVFLSQGPNTNPVWAPKIAFTAHTSNSPSAIANNLRGSVLFQEELFDEVGNFNGGFFAPSEAGLYHFDVSIKWASHTSATNYVETAIEKCDANGDNCVVMARNKMNDQFSPQQTLGIVLKLNISDRIKVSIFQTNSNTSNRSIETTSEATYFSGYIIR